MANTNQLFESIHKIYEWPPAVAAITRFGYDVLCLIQDRSDSADLGTNTANVPGDSPPAMAPGDSPPGDCPRCLSRRLSRTIGSGCSLYIFPAGDSPGAIPGGRLGRLGDQRHFVAPEARSFEICPVPDDPKNNPRLGGFLWLVVG